MLVPPQPWCGESVPAVYTKPTVQTRRTLKANAVPRWRMEQGAVVLSCRHSAGPPAATRRGAAGGHVGPSTGASSVNNGEAPVRPGEHGHQAPCQHSVGATSL